MKKSTLLTTSAIVIGLLTGTAYADTIRFWTTEHQPPRLAKQQQMADDFSKLTVSIICVFNYSDFLHFLNCFFLSKRSCLQQMFNVWKFRCGN